MNVINETDISKYMQAMGQHESQFIIPASDCAEEVKARLRGDAGMTGDLLPWSKTHKYIQLRPAEVSLWGGYSKHGKSQLLGQVVGWGLKQDRWLIASLEMKPSSTMERMTRQVAGNKTPPDAFVDKFLSWTDDKLWIYDQLDSVKKERILGMIHYAASELKIKHIVIDSLIKCGIGRDDHEGMAMFVDKLCWAAKAHNIHIHLIHHMRKSQEGYGEYKIPSKHDFRGVGEITDLVDNIYIVHRNKKKEADINAGKEVSDDEPDCYLKVDGNRHGEWEGIVKLWHHGDSLQYTPDSFNRPLPYEI